MVADEVVDLDEDSMMIGMTVATMTGEVEMTGEAEEEDETGAEAGVPFKEERGVLFVRVVQSVEQRSNNGIGREKLDKPLKLHLLLVVPMALLDHTRTSAAFVVCNTPPYKTYPEFFLSPHNHRSFGVVL